MRIIAAKSMFGKDMRIAIIIDLASQNFFIGPKHIFFGPTSGISDIGQPSLTKGSCSVSTNLDLEFRRLVVVLALDLSSRVVVVVVVLMAVVVGWSTASTTFTFGSSWSRPADLDRFLAADLSRPVDLSRPFDLGLDLAREEEEDLLLLLLLFLDDTTWVRIHLRNLPINGKTAKDFLGKSFNSHHSTALTSLRATGSKSKSIGTP